MPERRQATPLGDVLRSRRRQLNITQGQLAEWLDCNRSYIALIECGWSGNSAADRSPPDSTLDRLAAGVGWTRRQLDEAVKERMRDGDYPRPGSGGEQPS
ncbi:MAG: helix-turn-helix domain-containing protein [Actinomycetales bacterium]|nr:helix-turn-helix domain-containing protein [Actinomycetales bacterium]